MEIYRLKLQTKRKMEPLSDCCLKKDGSFVVSETGMCSFCVYIILFSSSSPYNVRY